MAMEPEVQPQVSSETVNLSLTTAQLNCIRDLLDDAKDRNQEHIDWLEEHTEEEDRSLQIREVVKEMAIVESIQTTIGSNKTDVSAKL